MLRSATARSGTPHLVSALIACAIVVGILCGGRLLAIQLERKTVHWVAPKDFFIKNQGLAFERAAARRPDILLLYGSSELTDPIPNRASDFFSSAPTGFQVCPVGKAGTTSLIILQKPAHWARSCVAAKSQSHFQQARSSRRPSGRSFMLEISHCLRPAAFSSAMPLILILRLRSRSECYSFPTHWQKMGWWSSLQMPCVRPSSGSHGSDGYLAAGQAANCHARFARSFRSAPLHPCRRQAHPRVVAAGAFTQAARTQVIGR